METSLAVALSSNRVAGVSQRATLARLLTVLTKCPRPTDLIAVGARSSTWTLARSCGSITASILSTAALLSTPLTIESNRTTVIALSADPASAAFTQTSHSVTQSTGGVHTATRLSAVATPRSSRAPFFAAGSSPASGTGTGTGFWVAGESGVTPAHSLALDAIESIWTRLVTGHSTPPSGTDARSTDVITCGAIVAATPV